MKKSILILFSAFIFLLPASVLAATLYVAPEKDVVSIGDEFTANIKIDSEGAGINAAQATFQYSKDVLEIISINKTGSLFEFWLREPEFSNETGRLVFVGGATSGFSGRALQILKIIFRVKGAGSADLSFTDAAVTAADGSGTNVLSTIRGAQITASPKAVAPAPPVQITRPAAPAEKLPAKPEIKVSLYPDPAKWYNISSKFSVSWALPPDVTNVATAINKDPAFLSTKSKGLFDNETFAALEDGIWYLHVRFKNNIGWGSAAHYRIAVDTVPPLPFKIKSSEELPTDNPTPKLTYTSGDQLSGLVSYSIKINDEEPLLTTDSSITLPAQSPAKKAIRISAEDRAGNITQDIIDLEILPIASPTISSVSRDVIFDEENIKISGTALPNEKVKTVLKDSSGRVALVKEAPVDEKGNWQLEFERPIRRDKYTAEIQTIDKRGAQSLIVKSDTIRVKDRPILTIAGFGITQTWFFVILILIIFAAFFAGWYSIKIWQARVGRKVMIAQRDVVNVFGLVKGDLLRALENYLDKKIDQSEAAEIEMLLKRALANIEKMQKYVVENIEEIKE